MDTTRADVGATLVARELSLWYGVLRYDVTSALLPNILFMIAAWKSSRASPAELVHVVGRGALYFLLYAFTFCLSNQWMGIEEDRLNKPDRPLVRRRLSHRSLLIRWAIGMALYSIVGWRFGVLRWTVLWQVATCLHNFGPWARHWLTKSLVNGAGVLAALAAAWEMVAPISTAAWRWIAGLSIAVFILVPLQDLRDVEGDRIARRRTLVLVFGERRTRAFLTVGFASLPVLTHALLFEPTAACAASAWSIALAALSLLIAWRVTFRRTRRADHRSYMLFTYWYCLTLTGAIFVL